MEPQVCLVSASFQNVFFGELLDALGDALSEHGIAVERSVDRFPALRDDLVYVFVPHELLPLLMEDAHPSEAQLRRSITVCTEQPGTPWFEQSALIAARASRAVDINRLGVAALKRLGIQARFLQLGYAPLWDRWHGDLGSERPVELALLAGATPRRRLALARCASQLAGRRTELHLPEALVPHRQGSAQFLAGCEKWRLLSRSKLLLNVHRGELGYFEWQRAVEAMVNGCVLLSEHSLGFEPLVPGEHFASVSFDSLDVALEGLLDDEERLARMRIAAYEFMRDEHPLSASIEVLAEAVDEVAAQPVGRVGGIRDEAVPRPKPPAMPAPAYAGSLPPQAQLDLARQAATRGHGQEHSVKQGLRSSAGSECGSDDRVEVIGPQLVATPRMSVVLAVCDRAAEVAAAIESVAASDFHDYELVIVDDCPGEASASAIRRALAGAPWVSAKLIARARAHGHAAALNLGVQIATGELLLMLDVDVLVYRHALGRLVREMTTAPQAAFAYGVIARFGVEGPSGLTGYLGWDPYRLRYGNFVEGMAMVRRSELIDAGGYATDGALSGWEDFALWCALADRGRIGVAIPEILACQRQAPRSTASVADIDARTAWSVMLARFACLTSDASA